MLCSLRSSHARGNGAYVHERDVVFLEEFARARERHDWREIAGEWFEAPVRRWIGTLDADGEPEDDTRDAVILAVGMREFLSLRDVMLVAAICGERADFTADRAIGFLKRPMMRNNASGGWRTCSPKRSTGRRRPTGNVA